MSKKKNNKVFDLFKTDFKITFFYKPSLVEGDDFYYLVLDEVVKLKIKEVNNALVIDDVIPVTTTYLKPIYEKIVRTVMGQTKVTVLISLIGNTSAIQQACINCNAPLVTDDRYVTVPIGYYNKLKSVFNNDNTKFGFYLLAVSDEEDTTDTATTQNGDTKVEQAQRSINNTPIGIEPPLSRISKILTENLKKLFPNMRIESASTDSIRCTITSDEAFVVEIAEGGIYVKEFIQKRVTSLNLIKIMSLVNTFEKFTAVQSNVYILSVQNAELNGLCRNKGYIFIMEEQKLPMNKLFRQAFTGYGTYQVINS
jgi:hypothetical protein